MLCVEPRIALIRNSKNGNYGGAEIYQIYLAKELKKFKYDTFIISNSSNLSLGIDPKKYIKAPFLRYQNWSSWRNIFLPFYILWQVYLYFWYKKVFKKHHPTTVNIQSRDDWIAATLAAKHLNIKVFWTDHADFRSWVLQNVNHKFKNPIGKYIVHLIKYVDTIIMISDFESAYLKKIINPSYHSKIKVIKNGVKDQYRDFKKVKIKKAQICYVGRLEDYKGIKELIKGYSNIAKRFPESRLLIYGSGSLSDYCNSIDHPQIQYRGFTDEPLKVIAESEIFILPSYREGLSLSLLDASMLGKAIIATKIDGNPEVVIDGKTGILIPSKDWKAVSDALNYLLGQKELSVALGEEARKHYLQNFDFQKTVETKIIPLLKS